MLWKDVPGYEGIYQVTRSGRVRRLAVPITKPHTKGARCRVPPVHELTQIPDCSKGYVRVRLFKNGRFKTFRVHRLVAMTYLPNPLRKREVNHKDNNKLHNHVSNLEWVTSAENFRHAVDNGHIVHASGAQHGNAHSISQHTLDGKLVKKYPTVVSAVRAIGASSNCLILKNLRGACATAYGYVWRSNEKA